MDLAQVSMEQGYRAYKVRGEGLMHKALKKINLNYKRNLTQDNTEELDQLAQAFCYDKAKDEYWNPPEYSLLWGSPLWDQASEAERLKLNHLYWVAYYAQIISAEIATIFFNQTSAASLYTVDEFANTCRMLDLESLQERSHINTFRTVGQATEQALFGDSLFMGPMKLPFSETMIYQNTDYFRRMVKNWMLKTYTLLSSGSVFIGCQYFTIRGLRTLNGKLIQHKLSQYFQNHPSQGDAPIPAKVSYHHFLDESYHFNSSTIISQDLVQLVKKPTTFEKWVVNMGVLGCQRDHYYFNSSVNGIFWYEPAMFQDVYRVLRSPVFAMNHPDAIEMMRQCFCKENQAMHKAHRLHKEAAQSYETYVADLEFLSPKARSMDLMKKSSIQQHLTRNLQAFSKFESGEIPSLSSYQPKMIGTSAATGGMA